MPCGGCLARKKKTFDVTKEVKAIARERVGTVPAAKLAGTEIPAQKAQAQEAAGGRVTASPDRRPPRLRPARVSRGLDFRLDSIPAAEARYARGRQIPDHPLRAFANAAIW